MYINIIQEYSEYIKYHEYNVIFTIFFKGFDAFGPLTLQNVALRPPLLLATLYPLQTVAVKPQTLQPQLGIFQNFLWTPEIPEPAFAPFLLLLPAVAVPALLALLPSWARPVHTHEQRK